MISVLTTLYAWEQFKEAAQEAAEQAQSTDTKWHVVFLPTLKQFDSTNKPHIGRWQCPDDEIIITFGDKEDLYSPQCALPSSELISTFAIWLSSNEQRIER